MQNAYSAKALSPTGDWLKPMITRAGIHACMMFAAIIICCMLTGAQVVPATMFWAMGFDFIFHVVMDRIKVSPQFLGRYKVASLDEMAKVQKDYESSDPDVVAAAQAKAKSNMYFWWGTGFVYCLYGLEYVLIAYILK